MYINTHLYAHTHTRSLSHTLTLHKRYYILARVRKGLQPHNLCVHYSLLTCTFMLTMSVRL